MRGSPTHALTRRDLAKVAASAPLAALLTQTERARAQELPDVPRERQLILCGGGIGGSFELPGIWNPLVRTGTYDPAMWLVN